VAAITILAVSRSYKNKPVALTSLIGQAFTHQDERRGFARLGLPFDPGTYELEARGYAYPLPGKLAYCQALSLARVPADAAAA
jgi:hypothetical protein